MAEVVIIGHCGHCWSKVIISRFYAGLTISPLAGNLNLRWVIPRVMKVTEKVMKSDVFYDFLLTLLLTFRGFPASWQPRPHGGLVGQKHARNDTFDTHFTPLPTMLKNGFPVKATLDGSGPRNDRNDIKYDIERVGNGWNGDFCCICVTIWAQTLGVLRN